jgi:hypothetical protein
MADRTRAPVDDAVQYMGEQPVTGESWERPFPRLPLLLVVVAAVLTAVSFSFLVTLPDFAFFAVNSEQNLATFFSVMLSVAAAASQAVAGRLVGGSVGMAFYVTAAVLFAMAFDDFAQLHERLDSVGDAVLPNLPGHLYLWVLPALVPAGLVLLAFWHLGRSLAGPARRDLLLGMGLVLVAALGIETVNGFLDRPGTNGLPLLAGTHVEEFLENLGLIILLRGSLSMLQVSWGAGVGLRIAENGLRRPVRGTTSPGPHSSAYGTGVGGGRPNSRPERPPNAVASGSPHEPPSSG